MFLSENFERLSLIFGSSIIGFLIAFILAPWFTSLLIKFKIGKQIREKCYFRRESFSIQRTTCKEIRHSDNGRTFDLGHSFGSSIDNKNSLRIWVFDHSLLNERNLDSTFHYDYIRHSWGNWRLSKHKR